MFKPTMIHPANRMQRPHTVDAFIESSPCLRSNRGRVTPRNCETAPWSHTLDVHFAQAIPVRGDVNVQITFDILNFMNLLDRNSGTLRYVNFNSAELAEVEGFTDDGTVISSLNSGVTDFPEEDIFDLHNVNSRYRLKMGVRLNF